VLVQEKQLFSKKLANLKKIATQRDKSSGESNNSKLNGEILFRTFLGFRYELDKKWLYACVENYLYALKEYGKGKQDLVSNINFFMNVPVSEDGTLQIVDGISEAVSIVDLQAEMDVLFLISNCPQINNPCNAYNPSPIQLMIWDAA
jgi:hypothetical protein